MYSNFNDDVLLRTISSVDLVEVLLFVCVGFDVEALRDPRSAEMLLANAWTW